MPSAMTSFSRWRLCYFSLGFKNIYSFSLVFFLCAFCFSVVQWLCRVARKWHVHDIIVCWNQRWLNETSKKVNGQKTYYYCYCSTESFASISLSIFLDYLPLCCCLLCLYASEWAMQRWRWSHPMDIKKMYFIQLSVRWC